MDSQSPESSFSRLIVMQATGSLDLSTTVQLFVAELAQRSRGCQYLLDWSLLL